MTRGEHFAFLRAFRASQTQPPSRPQPAMQLPATALPLPLRRVALRQPARRGARASSRTVPRAASIGREPWSYSGIEIGPDENCWVTADNWFARTSCHEQVCYLF